MRVVEFKYTLREGNTRYPRTKRVVIKGEGKIDFRVFWKKILPEIVDTKSCSFAIEIDTIHVFETTNMDEDGLFIIEGSTNKGE